MRRRAALVATIAAILANGVASGRAKARVSLVAHAAIGTDQDTWPGKVRETVDVSTRRPDIGVASRTPTAIRLDRLAIDARVAELGIDDSGTWQLPDSGVGWYWFTATPGTPGNAVMVGHFDTWWGGDGPLARLNEARVGDRIDLDVTVRTDSPEGGDPVVETETLAYAVATSRLVDRADVSPVAPTDDERLTLVTCAGWWSFTLNDYTMRRVVTALRAP
ncbi:MAG: class F sortase [Chloroflexi bacterium]|nr:class F sortase [Chloroflexota bacterium]